VAPTRIGTRPILNASFTLSMENGAWRGQAVTDLRKGWSRLQPCRAPGPFGNAAMPIVPPSADAFFRFEPANDEAANDRGRSPRDLVSVIDRPPLAEPLRQLVYVSQSRSSWNEAELDRLLTRARIRNGARGITGMLLYVEGSFVQSLEGPAAVVAALIDRIRADKRHWHVRCLVDRIVATRDFPDWSLGFRHCRRGELAAIGPTGLANDDEIARALGGCDGAAIELLRGFCARQR